MTIPTPKTLLSQNAGLYSENVEIPTFQPRPPTANDINYPMGKVWISSSDNSTYSLANLTTFQGITQAVWVVTGGASSQLSGLTGNTGTALPVGGFIGVIGTGAISTAASGNDVSISAEIASTTQQGVVELATSAQTITGTDSTRAVVPSGLSAKLGDQTVNGMPFGNGTTNALLWTADLLDGQIPIGSTSGNVAAANITSIGATITVTNGPNTINLEVAGGGGGITTIDGDVDSVTGSTVTIEAGQASANCGSSVFFSGSGTVLTMNVTDANLNTIVGLDAGVSTNTATSCTALGYQALASITDDDTQVAIGRGALQSANDGTGNTAVGSYALNAIGTSGNNTAVGAHSGITITSGNFNSLFGYFSGTNYTSSESSNILIGHSGVVGESNVMRLGTTGSGASQQNLTYLAGVYGNTASSTPMIVTIGSDDQLGTTTTNFLTTPYSYALSDETTPLTTSNQITFNCPFACNIVNIRASLTTTSSSGPVIFDITDNGTSIFSTMIQVDQGSTTSVGSVTPYVLSSTTLGDDDTIVLVVNSAGSGATGAKITLYLQQT